MVVQKKLIALFEKKLPSSRKYKALEFTIYIFTFYYIFGAPLPNVIFYQIAAYKLRGLPTSSNSILLIHVKYTFT